MRRKEGRLSIKSLRLQCSSGEVLATLEVLGTFQANMANCGTSVSSRSGLGIVPSFSSAVGRKHPVGGVVSA